MLGFGKKAKCKSFIYNISLNLTSDNQKVGKTHLICFIRTVMPSLNIKT